MGYFDDLLKLSSKSYNSYTSEFNNNYNGGVASYSTPSSSSNDIMKSHSNQIRNAKLSQHKINPHRSMLDRGLDTLMVGLYPTAGLVKGMVDGGSDNDISPLKGFVDGLKASNPFGSGYEKGEYTYSKVMESAGIKPTSTLGKITKGTIGFALDVLLDPTTYLTGGATALIKGTGRVGMLGKNIKELSPDMAKQVIQETSRAQKLKALPNDELEKASIELSKSYNQLMGVNRKGEGLTLSLGNAPLGKKIFGKYADKSIKLMDDMPLRKIGDKTFAPLYATTRDAIYGSKIGKMFSTKSDLYKLSQRDPATVYHTMQMIEKTKGLNLAKHEEEMQIHNIAKEFLNLTPAQERELMDALQDKTIWKRVKETLSVADTNEGKNYRNWLKLRKQSKEEEVNDLLNTQKNIEDILKSRSSDISANTKAYNLLQDELNDKLAKFDASKANVEEIEKVNKILRKQLSDVESSISKQTKPKEESITPESIVKKFDITNLARTKNAKDMKSLKDMIKAGNEDSFLGLQDELLKMRDDVPFGINETIDDINKYLFNGKNTLSYSIHPSEVKNIVDMIRKGDHKSIIGAYIESKPDLMDDKMREIYKLMAQKYGYGGDKRYKTWDEFFQKRLDSIQKAKKNGVATRAQLEMENDLLKTADKRAKDLRSLQSKSMDDILEFRRQYENSEMFGGLNSREDLLNSSGRGSAKSIDGDERRVDFINEDSAIHETSKQFKGSKQDDWVDRTMKQGNKNPVQLTYNDMMEIRHGFMKHMDWDSVEDVSTLKPTQKSILKAIEREVPELLEGFFRKNIDELSAKQTKFMYSLALQNAQKRNPDWFRSIKKADDELQKKVDQANKLAEKEKKKQEMLDKIKKGIKEEQDKRKALESTIQQRDDLLKELKSNTSKIKSIRDSAKASREEMVAEYEKRLGQFKTKIDNLEKEYANLSEQLNKGTVKDIDKLTDDINKIENALNDDDALDTWMRIKNGDASVDAIIKNSNDAQVTKVMLDSNLDVDEKVRDLIKSIRGTFYKAGVDEVRIDKLDKEQFSRLMWSYIPRIVTPEGAKFFRSKSGQEITKKNPSLTQDLGYGNKFNPHSKSRAKFKIELNGRWIENPTIHQLNEYLKPMLNGKNAFADSISDIYVARMLKHTELMYDHKYMAEMMDVFGKEVRVGDKAMEGYKIVLNFGQMKKMIVDRAKLRSADAVSKGRGKDALEVHFNEALKDFGITPNMLDELKMPMVELTEEQIAKIHKLMPTAPMKQVNDAIILKANQARKIQMLKDQHKFLQIYDKMTHLLKLNMTTVVPSFHIRNKFSNMFQNWLAVGNDALDPKFQAQAFKVIRNKGSLDMKDRLTITKPDGTKGSMEWSEVFILAKKHGVVDEGFFAKDIGAEAMTTGVLPKVKAKYDPTDSENFLLYRKGAEVGGYIENTDRLVNFASVLKNGGTAEEASASVNKFLFDYSDLTTFEKNVMKRIFPFYTWLRKNARLQLSQMLEQPEKYRHIGKVLQGVEGMNNEEDMIDGRYISNFAQDWVQTPFSKTNDFGRKEPILWNPNLPFGDMSRIPDPFNPVDSALELFSQFNPLIKVPVEQSANHHTFFNRPLVQEGDSQVLKRGEHILQQLALYNAGAGVIKKDGVDSALHALSNLTGLKFLSYDDKAYKYSQQEEILKNK